MNHDALAEQRAAVAIKPKRTRAMKSIDKKLYQARRSRMATANKGQVSGAGAGV